MADFDATSHGLTEYVLAVGVDEDLSSHLLQLLLLLAHRQRHVPHHLDEQAMPPLSDPLMVLPSQHDLLLGEYSLFAFCVLPPLQQRESPLDVHGSRIPRGSLLLIFISHV